MCSAFISQLICYAMYCIYLQILFQINSLHVVNFVLTVSKLVSDTIIVFSFSFGTVEILDLICSSI
jgi:hypothetical protein